MTWATTLAIISFLIGLVVGTNGMRSLRSQEHPQAEIRWKQPPLSPWKYETLTIIAVTIHTLGLVALAVFVWISATSFHLFDTSQNTISSLMLSIVALLAVFFTANSAGVALAYHVAQRWIRPISYGISDDGMWYGGMLIGWKSYSHYEVGPEDGLISLYSSYSPPLRTWVIQPPPESFSRVLGLIQKNLSAAPAMDDSISAQRSPLMLILEMAVLVIGVLLLIVWGWFQIPSWIWIYAFVAFLFVHYMGVKLMTLFDGRGQTSGKGSAE